MCKRLLDLINDALWDSPERHQKKYSYIECRNTNKCPQRAIISIKNYLPLFPISRYASEKRASSLILSCTLTFIISLNYVLGESLESEFLIWDELDDHHDSRISDFDHGSKIACFYINHLLIAVSFFLSRLYLPSSLIYRVVDSAVAQKRII